MLDGGWGECIRKNGIVNDFKGMRESAKGSMTSQSNVYDVNSVQNSAERNVTFNLMAAAMEIPANMEILHSTNVWVYDTAASNHFSKIQNGAYNRCNTDEVSQGMTGSHVEVLLLMDFLVTHYTKEGEEGNTFKMTDVSIVSRCLVNQ